MENDCFSNRDIQEKHLIAYNFNIKHTELPSSMLKLYECSINSEILYKLNLVGVTEEYLEIFSDFCGQEK